MIIKKIPARPAGGDATIERAEHARRLIDYLRLPEKQSAEKTYMVDYMLGQKLGDTSGERLFHIGGRGFVSETIAEQRAEMIAIAQLANRSPNPVDHWLLSWREGELPTAEQVDQTVAMFVEHLGVADQPCIYACHGDTHNRHVHVALNRYDPLAERMIEINDGFTLEAAHQAVALIVDRFGWQAEADARYEASGNRAILTASAKARIEEGREPIRAAAAAAENRTGYSSGQRIAQDEALPLITAARSWAELHASLAAAGMTYDLTGTNGVTISVREQRVKASSVARSITRMRLEKRFKQTFEPRDPTLIVAARPVDDDRLKGAFRADEYRIQCEQWKTFQEGKRKAAGLRAAEAAGPTTHMGTARAAALLRAEATPEPLKRPPPDLESWYYWKREGEFAKRWRDRKNAAELAALAGAKRDGVVLPAEVDGFIGYPCSNGTRYARGPEEPTAFIDRGDRIDVVLSDDEVVLAALRVAILKFDGKIAVRGDAVARDRIYAIGQANGLSHVFTDADFIARHKTDLRMSADEHSAGRIAPPPPNSPIVLPVRGPLKSGDLRNAGASLRTVVHKPDSVFTPDPAEPASQSDPIRPAANSSVGKEAVKERGNARRGRLFEQAAEVGQRPIVESKRPFAPEPDLSPLPPKRGR
ncbi:relaxase/mobilization nuclease domain-containing protein [Sphingomonas qilianensis]|uniref:Relaxase/mobilization nuclease domain-containing protein n=1 Tax=Sphingomonas qilianensis TaxID=1736690 RepID=A0ABU9XSE0_9SPHN